VPGNVSGSLNFWILLDGVIGKESTNTWCRGVLQGAGRSRRNRVVVL
jgi:hypothetical protein